MKKFLLSGSLALLLTPTLALAAYNDVTLTTSVVIHVGGYDVNVSGSNATISSIAVGASSFDVTVDSGSSMTVSQSGLQYLQYSTPSVIPVIVTCTSGESSLAFSGGSSPVTVTITPKSDTCPITTTSSGSGGGGNGAPVGVISGGGGGGGVSTPPASVTNADQASVIAALQAQVQALIAQLAALTGGSVGTSFSRDLQVGATGNDIKALQVYLNSHGYAVASSGPGSPGNETTKFGSATKAALAKFQSAVGISPASGYFGPKTRAYVNAHP